MSCADVGPHHVTSLCHGATLHSDVAVSALGGVILRRKKLTCPTRVELSSIATAVE